MATGQNLIKETKMCIYRITHHWIRHQLKCAPLFSLFDVVNGMYMYRMLWSTGVCQLFVPPPFSSCSGLTKYQVFNNEDNNCGLDLQIFWADFGSRTFSCLTLAGLNFGVDASSRLRAGHEEEWINMCSHTKHKELKVSKSRILFSRSVTGGLANINLGERHHTSSITVTCKHPALLHVNAHPPYILHWKYILMD